MILSVRLGLVIFVSTKTNNLKIFKEVLVD